MSDGACSGWIGEGDVGASDWRRKSVMFVKNDSPSHGGSVGDWWHQLVMLMFPFGDYEHVQKSAIRCDVVGLMDSTYT